MCLGVAALIYRYTSPLETTVEVRDGIYKLLNKFHRMCETEGKQYAITCGTLLGAIRHKSVIPIDDDADDVMSEEHAVALTDDTLKRHGRDTRVRPAGLPRRNGGNARDHCALAAAALLVPELQSSAAASFSTSSSVSQSGSLPSFHAPLVSRSCGVSSRSTSNDRSPW